RRRLITHSNAKSKSEKFPPPHQDGAVGFPMEPSHYDQPLIAPQSYVPPPVTSLSGPLGNPASVGPSRRKKNNHGDVRMAPPRVSTRTLKSASIADGSAQKGKETARDDF
ncbi:hypothetical protein SUGI_1524970, partial [Cryptomeria japonica]